MDSSSSSSWLLDYGLADEISATDFIWGITPRNDSAMLGFDVPCKEYSASDNSCSRKRNRIESCDALGTKACKEKLRRDKLNDRFTELCSILDPGRSPKADKVGILSDATRRLNQLRLEAQKLKDSNDTLHDSIKSLKVKAHLSKHCLKIYSLLQEINLEKFKPILVDHHKLNNTLDLHNFAQLITFPASVEVLTKNNNKVSRCHETIPPSAGSNKIKMYTTRCTKEAWEDSKTQAGLNIGAKAAK